MGTQPIHTDELVELYGMAKLFAENNQPISDRQEQAILQAEALIENNSGWKIGKKYDPDK